MIKKKYIYIWEDFEKSKHYSKFNDKERKILEHSMRENDPVQYFILQSRYKSIFTMQFKKYSVLGKTVNLLKGNINRLLFATTLKEDWDEYIVSLWLSDIVKLLLIDDLRERTWFSKHIICRILLLLRYSEHTLLSDRKELNFDTSLYYLHPSDFEQLHRNTPKEELNKKID